MKNVTHKPQISLREVANQDLAIFLEQQLDPDAYLMAAFPPRQKEEFHAPWIKILNNDTNIICTILYGKEVAGYISSFDRDGLRLIGYWLGQEYWGNGIATAALKEFLTIDPNRPVYAFVAEHNEASRKVLLRNGFTYVRSEDFFSDSHGREMKELLHVRES